MTLKLYHGTSEDCLETIKNEGVLSNFAYISEATEDINNVLEKYLDENLRDSCIFLTRDKDYAENYDRVLEFNSSDLDLNYLYVGDIISINSIYDECLGKRNERKLKLNANKYKKSFIPFSEYILIMKEYDEKYCPEFLYFKEIRL